MSKLATSGEIWGHEMAETKAEKGSLPKEEWVTGGSQGRDLGPEEERL